MSALVRILHHGDRRPRRGSIIATVLLFIALILPVTLILLNTIQIETLLPANENLRLLAMHEADKGFDAAVNLLLQDNDEGTWVTINMPDPVNPGNTIELPVPAATNPAIEPPEVPVAVGNAFGFLPYAGWDLTDPLTVNQGYFQPFYAKGEHEIDSLVEPWARHPGNDNYYLAARSRENRVAPGNRDETGNQPGGDPEEYGLAERWVLTNVPIGMDDFSERTIRDSRERLDTGFEARGLLVPIGPSSPVPVDQPIDTGGSSFTGQPQGLPLWDGSNWAVSPADPFFGQGNNGVDYLPRPASYFRNNRGSDNSIEDTLTYDGRGDGIGAGDTNQYPDYPPLQQLVRASGWANTFFGGPVGPADRFNFEYKPAPGSITRYMTGNANANEALPGWYQSIVSDESGRFPLHRALNMIFQGGNYVYGDVDVPDGSGGNRVIFGTLEAPGFAPDKFDSLANATNLMFDRRHPNHYNYLIVRDMIASLFLGDSQMRRMDSGALNIQTEMENAQGKANWLIRQMLIKRAQLDRDYDGNGNGVDDTASYRYKDGTTISNTIYDGNGRMGDGQHPQREGTWPVYTNPVDVMRDYAGDGLYGTRTLDNGSAIGGTSQWFLRPSLDDFARLHQVVTVHTYETEYAADLEQSTDLFGLPGLSQRIEFGDINETDATNPFFSTFRVLTQQIGRRRAQALLRWRDGQVDLNGDGDLDDEYILLPTVDRTLFNGDPTEPHSQITYRERNHPNFMDPAAANTQLYPAYLNIGNVGDMLLAPYNEPSEVLYSASLDASLSNSELVQLDATGITPPLPVPNTQGGVGGTGFINGDLDPIGGTSMLMFDGSGDAFTIQVPSGNGKTAIGGGLFEGTHPSYAPSDPFFIGQRLFVFQRTDTATPELWLADQNTGAPVAGPLPDNGLGLPALVIDGGSPLDLVDLSGPDWNPANANEVAYALGTGIDFQTLPPALTVQGDIYRFRVDLGLPGAARITNLRNDGTEGGFYPDYNQDGDTVVFSHIDMNFFNALDPFAAFDLSTVDVATQAITRLNITYPDGQNRAELMPVFSPRGDRIAFAGIFFDLGTGTFASDIWVADATGGVAIRATNTLNEFELYPVFSEGPALIARQSDSANGNTRGQTIPYPVGGINPVNTAANRVLLAGLLTEASVCLRDHDTSGLGIAQNWRFRDLPVVPEHMVAPLQALADEVAFRNPRSETDNTGGVPRLQAYGGKINLNTAPRVVLRAIFLQMFQGAQPNLDTSGLGRPSSPSPRIRGSLINDRYLNLAEPSTSIQDRFNAIKVADQYALQVEQYRKWLYNNIFLVSDDTVPNGFMETDDELTGLHYRANPNLPYDSDGSMMTFERPIYDPAPPFRNLGDLFNVALYTNYENVTGDQSPDDDIRMYEAVRGTRGPDWNAMPAAGGVRNEGTVATWTWGPIYQTRILSRYNGDNYPGSSGSEVLDPYFTQPILVRDADGNYTSDFALQQRYRLFSADDFRWIAPWLTVRSYVYRVESRGTVRVEANQGAGNRMDITADKFWILNMGDEAVLNMAVNGGLYDVAYPVGSPVGTFSEDWLNNTLRNLNRSKRTQPFSIMAYQEQPESGVPLTRPDFLPSF